MAGIFAIDYLTMTPTPTEDNSSKAYSSTYADDGHQDEEEARRRVTLELIRKRSEHHEGLLSDLAELDLHQDHLETIGPLLGRTCPNLTHLYLHNNVISDIEFRDWRRFQNLQRLSLALNNLTVLKYFGDCCPRLQHLDASFNFISLQNLQMSLECLQPLSQLQELFLQGNPCEQHWTSEIGKYVIAQLPVIQRFDGKEIGNEERKEAHQQLTYLQQELRHQIEQSDPESTVVGPELRAAMSREWLALRQRHQPQNGNTDRDDDKKTLPMDHRSVVARTRAQEQAGESRNCNEGGLHYELKYEQRRLVLEIMVPQWIPTDDLDLDVQSSHVSLVAQAKVLRLCLPHTILLNECQAERSEATGRLKLVLPLEEDIILPPYEGEKDDVSGTTVEVKKGSLMADMLQDAIDPNAVGIERIHLGVEPAAQGNDESDEEPPALY